MVYLLQSSFGKYGREEAAELLERRSGNADHPRILTTFNEPCHDWLSFFCFTMFTDRDGKYQLLSLAESGFEPLARTTRFMLTEEAHHMFVGQTGVARVVRRTCEAMNEHPDKSAEEMGVIPLETIQRYINYWASSSLDLFGAEVSSNSANFFGAGIKGRAYEQKNYDEHTALDQSYQLDRWSEGRITTEDVPLRNAMNEVLRDEYIKENEKGVEYWNRECEKAGIDFRFTYPNRRFNRKVGEWSGGFFHPISGEPMSKEAFEAAATDWLQSQREADYVKSLMVQVTAPGKFANWIAPPLRGINGKDVDFEYVKL